MNIKDRIKQAEFIRKAIQEDTIKRNKPTPGFMADLLDAITPKKGIHYFDGIDGHDGEKGKDGLNGRDGRDGINGKNGERGKNGIDGKDGKDGQNASKELILEAISEILDEKILEELVTKKEITKILKGYKFSVKNLSDLESRLTNMRSDTSRMIDQRWHGGGRRVDFYDLSPSLNGVLKTFTIPSNHSIIQITSSSAPFVFRPTVDYTGSGTTTLTFDSSIDAASMLAVGQSIILLYY